MTVEQWLADACADADARRIPELKPMLTALAQATRVLRAADWNDDAAGAGETGPADKTHEARARTEGGRS